MKDVIADVVKHTAGLGFIENVKVTGGDDETLLDAMDSERTVILKAKLHNAELNVESVTNEYHAEKRKLLEKQEEINTIKTLLEQSEGRCLEAIQKAENAQAAQARYLILTTLNCKLLYYLQVYRKIINILNT